MDLTNKKAKEIYKEFGTAKTITNIKNPNLEIKFVQIPWIIFFIYIIIFNFGTFQIFKGALAYIIFSIIILISIIGILSQFYKIYFYKNNLVYENILNKRKIIDVNEDNKISIKRESFSSYDKLTESYEDIINYNLYIEQNNIKIELNIKYVGSDKIKLLIDNLETKNITVTQQENTFTNKEIENNKTKRTIIIYTILAIISFILDFIVKNVFHVSIDSFLRDFFMTIGLILSIFDVLMLINYIDSFFRKY